jgi:large conductance mechanosensitive channel
LFITAIVNFMIIAFALFLVVRAFNSLRAKEEQASDQTEKDILVEIRDLLSSRSS